MRHAAFLVFTALLSGGTARAALLDVAPSGDDLTFTWDTPGPDTILRGTAPDALTPWLVGVTSPVTVPGENAVRGEHAFYKLESGSNWAYRIERTFVVSDPTDIAGYVMTLPERNAWPTSFALFDTYPTLVDLSWHYIDTGVRRSAARFGARVMGHDEPLPRDSGVFVAFSQTTTITIVGSEDPSYPGVPLPYIPTFSSVNTLLPVQPYVRHGSLLEVACGLRDIDWQDLDGNGWPDTCGTDLDGDGAWDTGLIARAIGRTILTWVSSDESFVPESVMVESPLSGGDELRWGGLDRALLPGDALFIQWSSRSEYNAPWRPPTW